MSDAIVDWRGIKPSITNGSKDNRVKVSIGSLGGWVRKEITSSLDEGENNKEGGKKMVRHEWESFHWVVKGLL